VGYADDLRPGPNFPTPWQGSPNVVFIGARGGYYDAGAIRIDNLGTAPVAVDKVAVDLQRPGPVVSIWGSFTIPAGQSATLPQKGNETFDTSDYAIVGCGQPLAADEKRIPKVTVTIGGVAHDFLDTGHILDTGGFDYACRGN